MPDQRYDLNIVDYGRGTEDGHGKDYMVTYRQGDEVNRYHPGSTSERWESVTDYWRASVASETLTGVTQSKIGDVCLFIYLFIYMFGCMYVILYFDPPYFCVRSAFDPVPNFTKQNPLVLRPLPVSP